MTSPQRILLVFGATTFALNGALYFALRHQDIKYHGGVQLGMCIVGLVCLLLALLFIRRDYKPKPKTPPPPNTCQCGHLRCYHIQGIGGCFYGHVGPHIDCECMVYIEASTRETRELEELRRMAGMK